jgi:hypothetical protein
MNLLRNGRDLAKNIPVQQETVVQITICSRIRSKIPWRRPAAISKLYTAEDINGDVPLSSTVLITVGGHRYKGTVISMNDYGWFSASLEAAFIHIQRR